MFIFEGVFQDLTMDFIERLLKSQGRYEILVVVNRLTKYVHFMGLVHPFSIQVMTQLFLDNVYKLHGIPVNITSDYKAVFLSKFARNF